MRTATWTAIGFVFALMASTQPVTAQTTVSPTGTTPKLTYVPAPDADRTSTRVGLTSRAGSNDKLPLLSLVAPDHIGRTLSDTPQLYWYISDATNKTVELAIIEESSGDRVYNHSLQGITAGFQHLDLLKEGVQLKVDKRYQFIVAVIVDPTNRAKDLVTSGFIQHVKPSNALAQNLLKVQGMDRAALLLSSGIWYDGLADLMAQLDGRKDDSSLISERDRLLNDVGLADLASAAPARGGIRPQQ